MKELLLLISEQNVKYIKFSSEEKMDYYIQRILNNELSEYHPWNGGEYIKLAEVSRDYEKIFMERKEDVLLMTLADYQHPRFDLNIEGKGNALYVHGAWVKSGYYADIYGGAQ